MPYLRVFLPDGVLRPGQSTVVTLRFRRESHAPPLRFDLTILSGQGNPWKSHSFNRHAGDDLRVVPQTRHAAKRRRI